MVKWIVCYQRIVMPWLGHEVIATSRVDANKKFREWAKAQPDDGMGYEIVSTNTDGGPRGLFVMDTKAKAKTKAKPKAKPKAKRISKKAGGR